MYTNLAEVEMAGWMKWRSPNTEITLSLRFMLPNKKNKTVHSEQIPTFVGFSSVPSQHTHANPFGTRPSPVQAPLFLNCAFSHIKAPTLTRLYLCNVVYYFSIAKETNEDRSRYATATLHHCSHNAFHLTSKQCVTLNWSPLAQNRNQIVLEVIVRLYC